MKFKLYHIIKSKLVTNKNYVCIEDKHLSTLNYIASELMLVTDIFL